MAVAEVSYAPSSGEDYVTLAGTVQSDPQFDVQPVAGDQVVFPDVLAVDAQLNITGPDGSYELWHVRQDGVAANESYTQNTPDSTEPTLTSASATATGQNTADGSVSTDEGNGTLYYLASTLASETASNVVASGQTQAVSATGVQNVSVSGLTEGTSYYLHFVHVDDASNQSTVASSGFTTEAAPAEPVTATVPLNPPAGYVLVTLSGTITSQSQFAVQPVAGDQVLYPDDIAVDSQLNISAADGTHILYHVRQDGVVAHTEYLQDSNDSTAPSLSNANATANGETALAVVVTTNEGNGNIYAEATANSTETSSHIITNGITVPVSGTGEQAFNISGLSPGTAYYVHIVHRDNANNTSSVISTSQVLTDGSAPGNSVATATVPFSAGADYTTATLVSGFDTYNFQEWPTGEPDVGWQLTTLTADGFFDSNGDYWSTLEHTHAVWVTDLAGVIYNESVDNTQLKAVDSSGDTTDPVITLTGGDFNLAAGSTYVEPGYSAADEIDGDLTSSVTVTGSVNGDVPGNYVLTYSVTDASGNTGTATRTITVVDQDAPTLTLTGGDVAITEGDEWVDPGYSASDNVDGDLTAAVVVTGSVDNLTAGTYTLSYTVEDAAGNVASDTRTVTVEAAAVDVIPDAFLFYSVSNQPSTTLVESNSITVTGVVDGEDVPVSVTGGQYAVSTDDGAHWGGWTSTGTNVRLNYQIKVRHTTSPYANTTTTTTLTVGGVSGSFVSKTATGDTTEPVITLVGGNESILEGGTWSEPGYAATDNKDGDLTASVVVTGSVDTNTPGLYVISYSVQDAAGNTATATRLVQVLEDVAPPEITLVGGNVAVAVDSTWVEPGYSAVDNKDGDVTGSVVVTGSVDTAVPGYYSLTYTVTDMDGNTGTATRVVRVGTGSIAVAGSRRSVVQPILSQI